MNNNDEYDFCGLTRGSCNYQINADKKIKTLEKALKLACERINNDNPVLKTFGFDVEAYYFRKAEEQLNIKIERDEEW